MCMYVCACMHVSASCDAQATPIPNHKCTLSVPQTLHAPMVGVRSQSHAAAAAASGCNTKFCIATWAAQLRFSLAHRMS